MKTKFLIQPSSAYLSECDNLSFSVLNLDVNKSYKIVLENGTSDRKITIKDVNCGVIHKDVLFLNSQSSVTGVINLNLDESNGHATITLYANLFEKIDQDYKLADIAVFSFQIKSKQSLNTQYSISVSPSIVNYEDRATISVEAKPHTKLQFSINSKRFAVKTNFQGLGTISLRAMDVIGRHANKSESLQKFAISYATQDDAFTHFYDSGFHIHFVPNSMRTLQSTNVDSEPECAILDKAPVNGVFVKSLDNFCDPHAFVGNYSIFTAGSFFNNKVGFCSQQLEIAPADSFDTCRIYNSTSVSYLDNGIGFSVFSSQQNNAKIKTLASRVHLNIVPSSYENVGSKTYVGTIVKPYKSSHKVIVSKVRIASKVTLTFRFSNSIAFDIEYTSVLGSVADVLNSLVALIKADSRLQNYQIDAFAANNYLIIRSDIRFTVRSTTTNATVNIVLNDNTVIDICTNSDAILDLQNNLYNKIIMLKTKTAYQDHNIVGFDIAYNVLYIEMVDGFNNNKGPVFDDYVDCQYFVLIKSDKKLLEKYKIRTSGVVLPAITNILGDEVSCVYPEIVTLRKKVFTDSSFSSFAYKNYAHIFCQAPQNGVYQLFHISSMIHDDGAVDFEEKNWKQLTNFTENKNIKVVKDGFENLHIVWESDRLGATQLFYSCLGVSSVFENNKVLTSCIEKNILAGYPIELMIISDPVTILQITPSRIITNQGKVSTYFTTSACIEANVTKDAAMACYSLRKDENGYDFASNYNQLSYQVSFDFKLTTNSVLLKTDDEIEDIYNKFLANFRGVGDYKYTDDSRNIYTINRYEKYYTNFIPFCSALKLQLQESNKINGEKTTTLWQHNNELSYFVSNQSVDFTQNTNARHFMLGLVPEKIIIKAKNTETYSEYCARNNYSLQNCRGYTNEKKFEVRTGRYKLALVVSTTDNQQNESLATNNYQIYRIFDNLLLDRQSYNFKIALHYSKASKEYLEKISAENKYNAEDIQKFLGDIIICVDDKEICATNFFCDFGDAYRQFDIALGVPYGQGFEINNSVPYKNNAYESISVVQFFENIAIGPHSIKLNKNYISICKFDRNIEQMCVTELSRNILTNRSFESTILPFAPATRLEDISIAINNWVAAYGCIVRMDVTKHQTQGLNPSDSETIYTSSHGKNWIELGGSTTNGSINFGYIQQTFSTIVGFEYVVTFDLSLSPETYRLGNDIVKTVEVTAASQTKIIRLSDKNHSSEEMNWKTYQFIFNATSQNTTLRFRNITSQFGDINDIRFGPQLDNVNVYVAAEFNDELNFSNIYSNLGITSEEWYDNYYLSVMDDFTQIPITNQTDRQNKTASLATDALNKLHIAYQSNRDNSWNIYYTGGANKNKPFYFDQKISDTTSTSINPSIAIDSQGRKIIAWQDNRSSQYQIYAAISKNIDTDIVDICKQSKIDATLYRKNYETDPYANPYIENVDQFACELKFVFPSDSTLQYHFSLYFYEDSEYQNVYKIINSKLDISGWYVDGLPMSYDGLSANEGMSYLISYQPSAEDDLQNRVFYVKVAYELKKGYVDLLQSTNVEIIEPYRGLDLRPGKITSNGAIKALLEFDAPSPRKISAQTQDILNRGGVIGCTFASGLTSLPGMTSGQKIQSVLLHYDAATSGSSLDAVVKFNKPILALVLNGGDLVLTNAVYGYAGIIYNSAQNSGLDAADTIVVSSDRSSIQLSLADTETVDNIRVILESNSVTLLENKLMYYCPTKQESRCNVVCNFTNNETVAKQVHFRITFYANPEKTDIIHSSFTQLDHLRWQIGNNNIIGADGIAVDAYDSVNVIYTPEILPYELYESQHSNVSSSVNRQSLLCGINYTCVVESFVDGVFYTLEETIFNCSCVEVQNNYVNNKIDWICSANGFDDLRISETNNVCLYPKVVSNISNFAYIVWQDYRYARLADEQEAVSPDYYMGIYNFDDDRFICSGQGQLDARLTNYVDNKNTLFDHALYMDGYQNLNIIFHDGYKLYWQSCTYGCRLSTIKNNSSESSRIDVCGFTDDTAEELYKLGKATDRIEEQYQKIRFTKSSIAYSTYLSTSTPMTVISDCFVELDIVGVPGTYAYRLRNENDENWSAWLPINADLPQQNLPESDLSENPLENENQLEQIRLEQSFFRAYFIEKERFIAPWITSKNSGSKRICCEILTFFGKTEAFCIDFIAEYEQLEYKVDLYYDNKFEKRLAKYNSLSVAGVNSTKTPITVNDLTSLSEATTAVDKIYARIEFKNKEKVDIANRLRRLAKYNLDLSMSVLQQGLNDQNNITLEQISTGVYGGVFRIYKNDGVFNIDGLALIVVNFPNACAGLPLNGIIDETSINKYRNLAQNISLNNNVTTYKDVYNADDPRYVYGNANYYKDLGIVTSDEQQKYRRNSWIGGGAGSLAYRNNYNGPIGGGIDEPPVDGSGDGNSSNGGQDPNDGSGEPPISGGLPPEDGWPGIECGCTKFEIACIRNCDADPEPGVGGN